MSACYIVRGINSIGQVTYYTGKAGHEWVNEIPENAFGYATREAARRKAVSFNKMMALHGWSFIVAGYIPNHGVVPHDAMESYGY